MLCIDTVQVETETPGLVTFDGITYYRRKFIGLVKYYDDVAVSRALEPVVLGEVYRLFNARSYGPYVYDGCRGLGDFFGSPTASSKEELLHELSKREDRAVLAYALSQARLQY